MVMVPDAGKMHFRQSDQQNSSGGRPRPPHGLRNFGARRVGLHTTWSAPQAKNPSYAPVVCSGHWTDGRIHVVTWRGDIFACFFKKNIKLTLMLVLQEIRQELRLMLVLLLLQEVLREL